MVIPLHVEGMAVSFGARSEGLADPRLDVRLTERAGDGDPMASVDDVVAVGTFDDGDGRQRVAATVRERDALPALGDAVRGRPERRAEIGGRVDRSDDRPKR